MNFPPSPGVYLMLDEDGKVLYVGKAKNLKKRLQTYFTNRDERATIKQLLPQVKKIDTIVVSNEKEAFLLENTLIKKHQPKYNLLLKDDKSYPYLLLTKGPYPQLKLVRKPTKGTLFGPFPSALAAKEIMTLALNVCRLRRCTDKEFFKRHTRPCMLYEIKRCLGPCAKKCTDEEYMANVEKAISLLKSRELLKELKREMNIASQKLEFERAKLLLDSIRRIEKSKKEQKVENIFSGDVINFFREEDKIAIALLIFRERRLVDIKRFFFSPIAGDTIDLLESFITQYYTQVTSILISPVKIPHIQGIKIVVPKMGKKKSLLKLAEENAKLTFTNSSSKEAILLSLQQKLSLTTCPKKIACIDASNLASTNPVAAVVVFINAKKDPGQTRLFTIKTAQKGDLASLEEALYRYLKKAPPPDLLLVDGGPLQLKSALNILTRLNLQIDVASLEKEKARHDKGLSNEKIYTPTASLLLDKTSKELFFLQHIRDEAHRAAISFQRNRRSQFKSALDELPGIGDIKKAALLAHFKSVENIKKSSKEDLKKIKGLTKKDIEIILSSL